MSVAKTADQKEANLASIRIIKARFAQDGQTFTDCIFNNDTMQIIIEDKRYPVKTTLKKATEDDVNRINDTAEIVKRSSDLNMHAQINQRVMSLTEMVNDPAINDDPVDLKQFENLGKNFDNEAKIVNMHVCADHEVSEEEAKKILEFAEKTLTEEENKTVKKDDILEIDETVKIDTVIEGVNEGVNEGISEGVNNVYTQTISKNDGLLELSGDTAITKVNETEVKLENISSPETIIIEREIMKTGEINGNNRVYLPSEHKLPVEILTKVQREEIEKNELLVDPDAPPIEHVDMINRLRNFEMHQNVTRKK